MNEVVLHEYLMANPDVIEEGCKFLESEVIIQGYRCDLLFLDKDGRRLYVEVKKKVDDKAVGQLLRYDGLTNNEEARFMLVGIFFVPGLKEALVKHKFEFKEITFENKDIKFPKDFKMPKRKSKYNTADEVIATFKREKARQMAKTVHDYVMGLQNVFSYLSNGIMIKRVGRNYKFL